MYFRLLVPPNRQSFFLFGPRGTGKTTWVKKNFPQALYLDLLEARHFREFNADPQRLEARIPKSTEWVILDEIQRIPELLNEVHRLIESQKIKFILTGSSARKLRRHGHNLLAGRALTCQLHPLTAAELGKDYRLEKVLRYGQLPLACLGEDPQAFLESYVQTYLDEEVRQEGLTRNIAAFTRFLEAASFSQGAALNISAVAKECAVERKVVEDYFAILEDLLIGYRVPVFTRRAKRKLVSHPKFYFFDTGIFRTLRPLGPLDSPQEIDGAALETLLFQELLAVNSALHLKHKIFFWRTAEGVEVDFILYGETGMFAFEVKRSSRVTAGDLKGLRLFLKDYPEARAFYVYGGLRSTHDNGIDIIPFTDLVTQLPSLLSFVGRGGSKK